MLKSKKIKELEQITPKSVRSKIAKKTVLRSKIEGKKNKGIGGKNEEKNKELELQNMAN
jgi:hypothetical protein